jgi:hypothetical protein
VKVPSALTVYVPVHDWVAEFGGPPGPELFLAVDFPLKVSEFDAGVYVATPATLISEKINVVLWQFRNIVTLYSPRRAPLNCASASPTGQSGSSSANAKK